MATIAQHDAMMERVKRENAPAWRHETDGDTLRGFPVTVCMSPADGEFAPYPKVTFRKEDGSYVTFHAFHTLVRERLRDRAEALATAIKTDGGKNAWNIVYLGERITNDTKDKPAKDQTTYHLYHVEIDGEAKSAEAFDFTQL